MVYAGSRNNATMAPVKGGWKRSSKSGKASSAAIFVAALVMLGSSPATAATDRMDTETAEAFAYANETTGYHALRRPITRIHREVPAAPSLRPGSPARGTGSRACGQIGRNDVLSFSLRSLCGPRESCHPRPSFIYTNYSGKWRSNDLLHPWNREWRQGCRVLDHDRSGAGLSVRQPG